jgi:hypothetical protein
LPKPAGALKTAKSAPARRANSESVNGVTARRFWPNRAPIDHTIADVADLVAVRACSAESPPPVHPAVHRMTELPRLGHQ